VELSNLGARCHKQVFANLCQGSVELRRRYEQASPLCLGGLERSSGERIRRPKTDTAARAQLILITLALDMLWFPIYRASSSLTGLHQTLNSIIIPIAHKRRLAMQFASTSHKLADVLIYALLFLLACEV
jgi:hypothetical protein